MQNWHDNVLRLIAEIDRCIRAREGETLTLAHLARLLDCLQSQVSHQFHALTGTSLREMCIRDSCTHSPLCHRRV